MPIWFFVFCVLCGGFALWQGIRNKGFYVGGAKIRGPVVWIAATVIIVAWGIILAIMLRFIPDHAP